MTEDLESVTRHEEVTDLMAGNARLRDEIKRLREEVADWKDRYESAKRDHEAEIKDIDDYYRTGLIEPWELSKCT